MDEEAEAAGLEVLKGRDWRLWFGVGSTLFWLWLGYLYIDSSIGWTGLAEKPIDTLGSFLEGAFAPLAFLSTLR